MIRITKEIEFCASHQLKLPYASVCENLHGHTYKLILTMEHASESLNNGMIMDFHQISTFIKNTFDHQHLNDRLPEGVNPTVENLIVHIVETLRAFCDLDEQHIVVMYARLYESPTSYAEYFPNLGNGLDLEVLLTKSDCSRENLNNVICKDCAAPTQEYCEGCSVSDEVEPQADECDSCGNLNFEPIAPIEPNPLHYPFVEMVKTVQGEGYNTGTPIYLIRLAGCNLSCDFCDTNHKGMGTIDMRRYIEAKAAKGFFDLTYPVFLITGGEPTLYDTTALVRYLRERFPHCQVWVESNGSGSYNQYKEFDYVTISPKINNNKDSYVYTLKANLPLADEIRVVAYANTSESRKRLVDLCQVLRNCDEKHLYLSPLATYVNGQKLKGTEITDESYNTCFELLDYIKRVSKEKWRLSLQMHKLLGIQ